MKTAIQRENNEFLVITLKHVSGLPVILNRPGTPILWAITHENGHNTQKRRVFGHALKHVSGPTVILNCPGTLILWAITHENGHNMQKRRVFGHNSQTCKSPWNPKTVGNFS